MKAYHSLVVFIIILACAALSSMHSYRSAEREMVADMNQALRQTLAEKHDEAITLDTIQAYRSYLRIAALRKNSIVCYALGDEDNRLSTQPMRRKGMKADIEFQGLANCSMASVFAFSDQRLPLSFSAMALLWALYTLSHQTVKLTPMQHALLLMFFQNPRHQLTKQHICEALWPKKPDASDTLYTLIKRIKPVLEAEGRLKVTSERGRDYRLEIMK